MLFAWLLVVGLLGACAVPQVEEQGAASSPRIESMIKMGDVHLREGRFRQAMKLYLEAEKLAPEDPELKFRIGLVYADYYKRLEDAERYYKQAIQLRKNYSEAYNNLGHVYLRQRRWDDAIAMFEKALDNLFYRTPEKAYYNMAVAYRNKGDDEKALEYYQMALELKPQFVPLYVEVGLFHRERGESLKALEMFQRARYILEKNLPSKGATKERKEEYRALLAMVCYHQGVSYARLRRFDEAREALQKALLTAPHKEQQELIQKELKALPASK